MPVQLLPGWLTQDTHHACSRPVSLAVRSVSHSPCLTVVGKAALLAGTSVPRGTGCNLLSEPSTWAARNAVPVGTWWGQVPLPPVVSTVVTRHVDGLSLPVPGSLARVGCCALPVSASWQEPLLPHVQGPSCSPSPADPGRQVL